MVLLSEIATCSEKNPKFWQLSFYDDNYDNILKNIELDYYESELTDYSVANMLIYQYTESRCRGMTWKTACVKLSK